MAGIFRTLANAVKGTTPEVSSAKGPTQPADQTRRMTAADLAQARSADPDGEDVTEMTLAVTGSRPLLRRIGAPAGAAEKFFLSVTGVTRIGRASDNDIVIDADAASSHHCQIDQQGSTYTLTDLGSTNKTWVNGVEKTKAVLRNGDEITMGSTKMVFALFGDRR